MKAGKEIQIWCYFYILKDVAGQGVWEIVNVGENKGEGSLTGNLRRSETLNMLIKGLCLNLTYTYVSEGYPDVHMNGTI